ncbi:TetR/AcrR family transcriptional regulator [Embleya sp. AB8]|uniref:TetR/AcrR family transcriptional regulator n=1 Tax=Embleya sp. AB8 TaxID=3156304 RepID=UPI003C780019
MPTPESRRPTPQRLLDAAEKLMRTTGLAGATTKAIAREAGCSEAALYKYFTNKEELFVRVLTERSPSAAALMRELTPGAGEGRSVEEHLTDIARYASEFYADGMPMAGSLFAAPALLERHRAGIRQLGKGPHVILYALADCLREDRERGRIRADADPDAAAALLLGACFQRAFFLHFSGPEVVTPVDEFAPSVARTVWVAVS